MIRWTTNTLRSVIKAGSRTAIGIGIGGPTVTLEEVEPLVLKPKVQIRGPTLALINRVRIFCGDGVAV